MGNSFTSICQELEAENIVITDCPLHNKALCLEEGRIIGVDSSQFETEADLCTAVIHEGGHFISGAFYKPFSPYQIKEQAEYRADKAAILRFVPLARLKAALLQGRSLADIAEDFSVTEEFIFKAYLFYKETLGVKFYKL